MAIKAFRLGLIAFLAVATVALPLHAQQGATITFRKVFKSSYPEFTEIKVSEDGTATADIRQLSDDPSPESFAIDRPLVDKIFQLAAQLHNFDGVNLDVHRKIANLGQKTFRYEKGAEVHETAFNYTADPVAAQLTDLFEGISREETDISDLTRTMKYDRLGVNDVMGNIEADYNNKALPEPERLLPVLDQLASGEQYLDIAREKARTLAGRIRNGH
jgi:hypothetical protein